MTPVLIIDTSLFGVAAATAHLSSSGCTYVHRYLCLDRCSAEKNLPVKVSEMLSDFSSPTKIIVSVGPGSFTGIRIGLAFAFGLAPAPQAICGLSSLQTTAELISQERQTGCNLFLPITPSYGIVARISRSAKEATLTPFDIATTELELGAVPNIVCGNWPQVAELLSANNLTVETIENRVLLDYALKGLAKKAYKEINKNADSWPVPLYLREAYGQRRDITTKRRK